MSMDENDLLEVNADLMILIREKQETGAFEDAISLQTLLHKNLIRLRQYMDTPNLPIPEAPRDWKPPPPRVWTLSSSGGAESTASAKEKLTRPKKTGETQSLLKRAQRRKPTAAAATATVAQTSSPLPDQRGSTQSGQGQGRAAQDSTREQQVEAVLKRTALSGASRENPTPPPPEEGTESVQASPPPSAACAQQQKPKPKHKPLKEKRLLEKSKNFRTVPQKRLEPRHFQPLFAPPWMANVPGSLVGAFPPGPFGLNLPGVASTVSASAPLRIPSAASRPSRSFSVEQGPCAAANDRRGIGVDTQSRYEDGGQTGSGRRAGSDTGVVDAVGACYGKGKGCQRKDRPEGSGRGLGVTRGEGLRPYSGGKRGRGSRLRDGEIEELDTRSNPPRLPSSGAEGEEQPSAGNRLGMLLDVGMLHVQGSQRIDGHVPLVAPQDCAGGLVVPTLPPPSPTRAKGAPSPSRRAPTDAMVSFWHGCGNRDDEDSEGEDDDQGESNRSSPGRAEQPEANFPSPRQPSTARERTDLGATIDAQPWVR